MKKLFFFITGILLISSGFSQNLDEISTGKFSTGVDIFTDSWQDLPEGMTQRTINQGVNFYLMYNHPFAGSNFSGALGIGIGTHNLYNNSLPTTDSTGSTVFVPIEDINYRRSKITLTYLDFPIEFRYKSKDKFRLAIGFKAGVNISSHMKYKGDELNGILEEIKIKSYNLRNLEDWRYGVTAAIGYKFINMVLFYSLSQVFEKGRGPELYPISIGISLRPF